MEIQRKIAGVLLLLLLLLLLLPVMLWLLLPLMCLWLRVVITQSNQVKAHTHTQRERERDAKQTLLSSSLYSRCCCCCCCCWLFGVMNPSQHNCQSDVRRLSFEREVRRTPNWIYPTTNETKLPYVWFPKPENYWKIAKSAITKAREVPKLRLSDFHKHTSDYL